MPQITNTVYRLWCKTCAAFTIHKKIYPNNLEDEHTTLCKCSAEYTNVLIRDIPKELVEDQRLRYKIQRRKILGKIFSYLSSVNDIYSEPKIGYDIIESDAGLEQEEKILKERETKLKQEKKAEQLRFKDMGRNDSCLCGSGLKYKKCCVTKH